jgi:hypothetical protein
LELIGQNGSDFRRDEQRRGRTAVHVHLLEYRPGRLDRNHDRRKETWNARRGDQHLTEQLERRRAAALGDGAHVPNHGALAIQVGGRDQQEPALGGLRRNGLHHLFRRVMVDQIGKRFAPEDAGAEKQPGQTELHEIGRSWSRE